MEEQPVTENPPTPAGVPPQKPTPLGLAAYAAHAWTPLVAHAACGPSVVIGLSKAVLDVTGIPRADLVVTVGLSPHTAVTISRAKDGRTTYRIELREGVTLLGCRLAFDHGDNDYTEILPDGSRGPLWELMGDDDMDPGSLELEVTMYVNGADLFAAQGDERVWSRGHDQR